jgi:hypothetical protein
VLIFYSLFIAWLQRSGKPRPNRHADIDRLKTAAAEQIVIVTTDRHTGMKGKRLSDLVSVVIQGRFYPIFDLSRHVFNELLQVDCHLGKAVYRSLPADTAIFYVPGCRYPT